ncbi:MAG: NUDIX hydrolase [Micrococcales bacterium]|nr:NUDIX hydrolase [Micrococcales bacterium]
MAHAAHDPARRRPFGPEDRWVDGSEGRFWGAFGAAGLLVHHPDAGVLLQLRVGWSHFGGTWGIPGGARKAGESAIQGALREADEEAGVPPDQVEILGEHVRDLGYWSYVTVLARARAAFEPRVGDAESLEVRWVTTDRVDQLPLHPGFALAWPQLRERLAI